MKKSILVLLPLLLTAAISRADMESKAVSMDVRCTSEDSKIIDISSTEFGLEIFINKVSVLESDFQPKIQDEGGAPYIQMIGGGYNISIDGGILIQANLSRGKIIVGEAPATITPLAAGEGSVSAATCKGSFQVHR